MRMSINIKTNFKRVALVVLVGVMIVLAMIGYFFAPKEEKKPEEEVALNPIFKEIPTPTFPAVSGVAFAPEFIFSSALTAESAAFPKTTQVYKIATFSATLSEVAASADIAQRLGFLGEPRDLGDRWLYSEGENLLFVNKADLSWELEQKQVSASILTFSKEELIQKVAAFLKEKSFWKKSLNEAAVEAVGYDNMGVVLGQPADSQNPDLWLLSWTLQKDGWPIYGSHSEPLITAVISKFGEISKISYSVSDIEFEVVGTYPVVSFEDLAGTLSKGQGVIVEASEPGQFYSSVIGKVVQFGAQQVTMFYYQDTASGFLVPVVEATGQAKMVSNKYVVLKVWVPAISPEWLK
ncbi:MAG: hypothetical protein ABH814_02105 [bacterium]